MDSLEQDYYEYEGFWDPEHFTTGEAAKRIAATVALIPADARTLADIGSGTGEFARQVTRARPDVGVHCVDRSQAALRRVTGEKSLGSLEAIPLAGRSKDVVSCLQVLEHIPVPIYEKALDELARVADRNLLVSVPFEENLSHARTECPVCGSTFNADLHLRSYSLENVKTLFAARGFCLREHRYVGLQERVLGLETYERFRRIFAPRPKVFMAPSCPICGHSREARDQQRSQQSVNAKSPESPLKNATRALKAAVIKRLPTRRLPDYWIIALYQRQ